MSFRERIVRHAGRVSLAARGLAGWRLPTSGPSHWTAQPLIRAEGNPLIRPGMPSLEGSAGANINGPSVIRVPDWVQNRLGRYYMYFAHHEGEYIRLAVAERPEGPWSIHETGALRLEETPAVNHIASPDVVVDHRSRTIKMYFHGSLGKNRGQRTFLATSPDGLRFTAAPTVLGPPYFRVFQFDGAYYAIAKRGPVGILLRSEDGATPFEEGPVIVPRMRHAALYREDDRLFVFYSRIGDAPEQVLRSEVRLGGPWTRWVASRPIRVLRPEASYEGVGLPISASVSGKATGPVHELRDPALLVDIDAQYLFYSVAGEQGISMARFMSPRTAHRSLGA